MKRGLALSIVLSCVLMVAGCSYITIVNLYPVQGPAAAMAPPPYYQLTIKGNVAIVNGKAPAINVVLGNGESFHGSWNNFTESSANQKTPGTADSFPPQPNLAFAWDAVYGKGFFVAHLLGQTVLQTTMTGSQGTVLQAELQGRRGVAIDSKGNVYKMTW
ncbi:MAG: hypothetical protein WBA18_07585 [Terracidiphilus sp.]